jgi:hypothetical protein
MIATIEFGEWDGANANDDNAYRWKRQKLRIPSAFWPAE